MAKYKNLFSKEAAEVYARFSAKQKQIRKTRHFNGSCPCYVEAGKGINGTKNSGQNCLIACLPAGYRG